MNENKYYLTIGRSRKETVWKLAAMTIPEFFNRLSSPTRGTETLAEYMKMSKAKQDDLKDVGGFVAGTLRGKRRKADAVTGRCMVTLDFDSIPANMTDEVIRRVEALGWCYCVYSTRKHRPEAPRLRIVFPADRIMSPDEHEPVARKLAEKIGIEMADPTTFEANRLFFWPSVCSDGEFVCRDNRTAPCFSVDGVLSEYADWHDITQWPQVPGSFSYAKLAEKQGDPLTKSGIVGEFCRAYDVFRAIDELLPGVYLPCDNDPNRFSYAKGSTSGGAVVYDDGKFLYSFHSTDPCSNKLVNAFDLVRLHKYGELDDNAADGTTNDQLPSYKAMREYANSLDEVVLEKLAGRQAELEEEFGELVSGGGGASETMATPQSGDAANGNWLLRLKRNQQTGEVKNTIDNFSIALEYDPRLKDRLWKDAFADRIYGMAPLPWGGRTAEISGDRDKPFIWTDADDAGLRAYFERLLNLDSKNKLSDALMNHFERHSRNPVQDYLKGLVWDSRPRLDNLFIDYLGAEDNEYTRAVTRKAFTAAVARAMRPGVKFDNMLILCGPQGIGKSTILSLMAKAAGEELFNDSIRTFEGKESSELLQGIWIVEIAELSAFNRSEVGSIKQFLSLSEDKYRAPYERRMAQRPRRCVFFGTCNDSDFLRDPTGNRRFWPVDVNAGIWSEEKQQRLLSERDQIWAEARMRFVTGEVLYLTGAVEEMARQRQEAHMETDPQEGRIAEFLERPIPADWQRYDLNMRQTFWGGGLKDGGSVQLVQRKKVCAAEIMKELFNYSDMVTDRRRAREINATLQKLGWKPLGYPDNYGPHGRQRGYARP